MGLLVFLISVMIVVGAVWYENSYCEYKKGCIRKISFQKFLEIYENAPTKFSIYKGYITYYSPNSYSFYFSVPETFRYNRWRKNLKRNSELLENNKKMQIVEKLWREDAEKHKKEFNNGN